MRRKKAYNLQFYSFTVELNCTDLEIYANCGNEGGRPRIIAESQQQTRLSDTYQMGQNSYTP
jgi:hypothetical protein